MISKSYFSKFIGMMKENQISHISEFTANHSNHANLVCSKLQLFAWWIEQTYQFLRYIRTVILKSFDTLDRPRKHDSKYKSYMMISNYLVTSTLESIFIPIVLKKNLSKNNIIMTVRQVEYMCYRSFHMSALNKLWKLNVIDKNNLIRSVNALCCCLNCFILCCTGLSSTWQQVFAMETSGASRIKDTKKRSTTGLTNNWFCFN